MLSDRLELGFSIYRYIKKKVGNITTSHILIFPRALSVKQHLQEVCKQYAIVYKPLEDVV